MALDMGKDKIRVNSISPAWIWSPEVSKIDPKGRHIVNMYTRSVNLRITFLVSSIFQKKQLKNLMNLCPRF